jgi:hypothetical protein
MRFLPVLMTAFLGYGCAAKKMAAQNADLMIEHQIEKRMPLYSAQKTALAKDVNLFMTEQKLITKEILPALKSLELDVSKIDQQYDKLDQAYRKIAFNFAKLMSKYMGLLDEKQQKDFNEHLRVENAALARVEGEARMDKLYDRFETLMGTISDKQKAILEAHKPYLDERYATRLKRREALHTKFKDIYQMDLSAEGKRNYFVDAFGQYQNSYPDNAKNKEIIKQLIPTLSVTQKQELHKRVKDLQEILGYYLATDY